MAKSTFSAKLDARRYNSGFTLKGSNQGGGDDGNGILSVVLNNAGSNPTFTIGLPNGELFTTPSVSALTTSDWYHFGLTFDGNNGGGSAANFYWTKVEESATEATLVHTFHAASTTAYDIKAFQIGNWNDRNFDGLVDDFRISNVARSANQFIFVPEPTATLSMLLGAAGLLLRRRRA